jgi:hypothetical protein
MNDLHVMTCAECTRDLIELRRERQIALKETSLASRTRQRFNWSLGVVAASICFVAVGLFVTTRRDPEASQVSAISTTVPVATMVDLSVDGVSRGAEERSESPVALPRKLLDLHIRLPYFSPSGSYRIFLSKQKDRSSSIVSATAAATVNGSKTDLQIRLDLSKLSAGDYFLGTQRAEDESANFYAVSVN